MSNPQSILDSWLYDEGDLFANNPNNEEWIAAFDADRQLVVSKMGPYKRMFLRPLKFTKRFYHQIFPVQIENWTYTRQINLFENFCTLELNLDIRFQATLEYLQRNSELIETINAHIIATYTTQVDDIVDRELEKLSDGAWVKQGLQSTEKAIAIAICEMLTVQYIQAQCLCTIKAEFSEFPDVKPGKDHVYLSVLKKSYEAQEEKSQETLRQQQLVQQQTLAEKERQLEYLRELTELELRAQALEAEKSRRLLQDKQDQLVKQLAIEKAIREEQIRHEAELKALAYDSEMRESEKVQVKRRQSEIQQLTAQLAHENQIEQQKLIARIQRDELINALKESSPYLAAKLTEQ